MTESVFIRNRSGSLPGLGTDAAGGYENTSRRIDENVQKQEEISAITQHCGFSEALFRGRCSENGGSLLYSD